MNIWNPAILVWPKQEPNIQKDPINEHGSYNNCKDSSYAGVCRKRPAPVFDIWNPYVKIKYSNNQ